MKKTIFAISTAIFLLTACDNQIASTESDSSSSSSSGTSTTWKSGNSRTTLSGTSTSGTSTSGTTTTSSSSTTVTYSEDSNIFEISSSVSSVTIEGLSSGKTIYLTKTNPTSSAISSSYTRYVTGASGISLSSGDITSSSSSSGSSSSPTFPGTSGPRHCISLSLTDALPQIEESSSRSATSSITKVTPASYTQSDVGSATRSIYIDQDSDISTFKAETATLRALGEYCYVWVVSDNWTSSSASGEKINSEIAEKIASNFDSMYLKIRNVFGEESNYLSSNTSLTSQIAMSDYSETGEIVNIVIYDIGKDYSNNTNSGSVVGYFYAKDYFYLSNPSSVYKYSNKGKYFYVDAYFAVAYTSTVYSTLAHEFQHMIDFGVKTMDQGIESSTAHNEMKSMLCEDIMYGTIEAIDSEFSEEDSPVSRLPLFNRHYADVGLEYKTSSPEVYYSYANNYAFGAWLLRAYGGITLLHEFATNDAADETSIIKALGTTGSETDTMEELLKAYSMNCVLGENGSGFKTELSASDLTFEGYEYTLNPIDIWNLADMLPESYAECKDSADYYKFDGPYLYGYKTQTELRPYGMALHVIGTAEDESVTIQFNTSGISTNQRVYVVVE